MTPVPSSPVALLDQLDELRAKATPGPWHTWRDTSGVPMVCTDDVWIAEPQDNPADAALIVAAVNAVGPLTDAVRAVLEMHRTIEIPGSPGAYWCQHCQLQDDVSCPTVHALTAALSVTP